MILTPEEQNLFLEEKEVKPQESVFERLDISSKGYMFERLEYVDMPKKKKIRVKGSKKWKIKKSKFFVPNGVVDTEIEEGFVNTIQQAPLEMEDGVQATIDELQEINLGCVEDPKPFLKKWCMILVFTWGYQDMPGLYPEITMHKLAISEDKKSVKQHQTIFDDSAEFDGTNSREAFDPIYRIP
ncbi:LOW QUALITY PROTEIN: hypothetical protein V2J09_006328 [Rumex salicifolius]